MSAAPISKLPKRGRSQLLDDLNYLNMAEIKSFCRKHSIPYAITIEAHDGSRKKTTENDRKGVILNRIRTFLEKGVVPKETCFRAAVVSFEPPRTELKPDDRLFYGQYDKTNRSMLALLKGLTLGKFRDGAIARILARQYWANGKAPAYKEFAVAWLQASQAYTAPNPEWAFLSDRTRGTATRDWKKLRAKKAANVMKILNQISCQ